MKIRMKTLYAGPNGVMQAGGEYDVSAELAQELILERFAESLEAGPAPAAKVVDKIETTANPVEVIETAVKPAPSKKKVASRV